MYSDRLMEKKLIKIAMQKNKYTGNNVFIFKKVSFDVIECALLGKYNFLEQGLCPQKVNYFHVYTWDIGVRY